MVKKSIVAIVISVLVLCGVGVLFYEYNSLDNRLWRRLVEDRPELSKCNDEYEKADIIRDWAYENVLFAGHPETYSDERGAEYLESLLKEEDIDYGYYCGGISEVLSETYAILGYNSCVLGLAVYNENGDVVEAHAVTLVQIENKWLIQDATFNISYCDMDGETFDVIGLQQAMVCNNPINIAYGKTQYRYCIFPYEDYSGNYEIKGDGIEKNGRFFFWQNTSLEVYLKNYEHMLRPYYEKDGYEVMPATIYMYPYAIYLPVNRENNDVYDVKIFEKLQEELDVSLEYLNI